ncbi:MAG: class I SAM-dependent methyltransferase [Myxococcota bacterium]
MRKWLDRILGGNDVVATKEDLERKVREIGPWFHQIEVGEGVQTRTVHPSEGPQPEDHPRPRWEKIRTHMPEDLSGQRIFDLGCSDGFFAIEMARRGASEIVAIDWAKPAVERLQWLSKQLDLPQIKASTGDIYALPDDLGRFDFVFMFALLYHLKEPLLGLEIASQFADEIYLETIADSDFENSHLRLQAPRPGVHSIPKWIPTQKCLRDMLDYVGFRKVEVIDGGETDRRPILHAWRT